MENLESEIGVAPPISDSKKILMDGKFESEIGVGPPMRTPMPTPISDSNDFESDFESEFCPPDTLFLIH